MQSYETTREQYRPDSIKVLLVAESPPPKATTESSRHFYRTDKVRRNDRLFINTIKALYPEANTSNQQILEQHKAKWLNQLKVDGIYMIEALRTSLPHHVSKKDRQDLIKNNMSNLIERMSGLASSNTKIILIKSNVFEIAAEPLRKAGFNVLNKELVDYPGQYNQRAYQQKLKALLDL